MKEEQNWNVLDHTERWHDLGRARSLSRLESEVMKQWEMLGMDGFNSLMFELLGHL